MKPMKRAVHFDFHTMPGINDFCANFSAEDFAKTMEAANIDYVNIFARCNLGFSYYPTKVGTPYPTMKTDVFGDSLRELKKRGIGVTAYVNGGLNHELLAHHTDYAKVNKSGSIYEGDRVMNNFFRSPCFNGPYRAHLLSEIDEILEYDPDGMFFDCLRPIPCYCSRCVELMKAKGININDDEAVMEFAVETVFGLFEDIRKKIPDGKRVYFNSIAYECISDYVTHAELECLPSAGGEWGYDFIATQAPYHRKFSENPVYMTGRFVDTWGDIHGNKSKASLENDVYDALLYGYAPSIGDHMNPRDGVNKGLYKNIGECYAFVKSLEPYTDGTRPRVDAAILRNVKTKKTIRRPITASDKGVARMLGELKIPYDVVNEDMDLSGYKLLVLPDSIEITDKLEEKLESFNGAVLSSGKSVKASPAFKFIREIAEDTNTDGFYSYGGETYPMYEVGVKIKSDYSAADYVEPYFNKHYDGYHGYFYIPADKPKGYSAVAVSGKRAHIAFNVFSSYIHNSAPFHKQLVNDVIAAIMPERLIETDLPTFTRVTLMSGEAGDILHVKTTFPEHKGGRGIIDDHVPLPDGYKVSVLGEYDKAYRIPDMTEIAMSVSDGRSELTLPKIVGYAPFLLVKSKDGKKKSTSDNKEKILAELKRADELCGKEIIDWLISLYDPESGGFYYSISARDTEGFLPDLESTYQAVYLLQQGGMYKSGAVSEKIIPKPVQEGFIEYARELQDEEDGYFYHTHWGKKVPPSRKNRDLMWARGLINKFGGSFKYPLPEERIKASVEADGDSQKEATVIEERFTSKEKFLEYLSSMNWETGGWGAGNLLASQVTQIKAAGLFKVAAEFLAEKQNKETGLWGEGLSYANTNAAMKISAFFGENSMPYPNLDKMINSVIYIIKNEGVPIYITDVWNPIVAINQAKATYKELPEELSAKLNEALPKIIHISVNNAILFKKADGAFGYHRLTGQQTSQCVTVSTGANESDVNGSLAACTSMRGSLYALAGIAAPPIYDKYAEYFHDKMQKICENAKKH